MTEADRAAFSLRAHEAVLAMHRDNGDKVAARAAQARVNGLRVKAIRLANQARNLADLRAWMRGA